MTRRAPKPLPQPTAEERQSAREASQALRTAIADPATMGARSVMHIDLARPRRGEWHVSWANLPGFACVNGRFRHASLPGWDYSRAEVRAELIPDLDALAERGVRPVEATSAPAVAGTP